MNRPHEQSPRKPEYGRMRRARILISLSCHDVVDLEHFLDFEVKVPRTSRHAQASGFGNLLRVPLTAASADREVKSRTHRQSQWHTTGDQSSDAVLARGARGFVAELRD